MNWGNATLNPTAFFLFYFVNELYVNATSYSGQNSVAKQSILHLLLLGLIAKLLL
jgi:hypothetical protein